MDQPALAAAGRSPLGHRPGLDGLRGVAVLAVVAFHGGAGAQGGALGVDLFLVLSGFLITSLLVSELHRSHRVDLATFWGRRARRLLPALLAVVAAVVAATAVRPRLADGYSGAGLRGDALATLGYAANWRYVLDGGDYFASFAAPSPLLHTWSLAVEEQWYLLWPLAFWALHRVTRGRAGPMMLGIIGLALASATAMWLLAGDVDRVHYGTDTRAQGLLAGAALAVAVHRWPTDTWSASTRRLVGVGAWPAAAVAGWMILRVGGTTPWLYRGGHLLFAAAGTAVTAAALVPGASLARVLSLAPLRWAGLVSYGLYLWHWPLFVWLTPASTGLERWPLFAVRCGIALGVATGSYLVVEQPIRRQRTRAGRPVTAGLVATAACAALVAAVFAVRPGPVAPPPIGVAAPPADLDLVEATTIGAAIEPSSSPPAALSAILSTAPPPPEPDGDVRLTVLGDSTGWTLADGAADIAGLTMFNGAGVGCGLSGAPAQIEGSRVRQAGRPVPCAEMADLWVYFASTTDPDAILVVLGAWEVYDRFQPGDVALVVGTPQWRAWLEAELESFLERIAVAAPDVRILLTDVPCYAERDPWLGGPDSPRNDPARVAAVNDVLEEVVARYPARLSTVPLSAMVCSGDVPVDAIDGLELRPDGVHVRGPAVRLFWSQLVLPALGDAYGIPAG